VRVRGYEGVPGGVERNTLCGSMKAWEEGAGPSVGKDRLRIFVY